MTSSTVPAGGDPGRGEWRPIPDYPGYEVTEYGIVRSIPRTVLTRNGKLLPVRGKVLNPNPDARGYLRVHVVSSDGRNRQIGIHALIAYAFIGPRPDGMQVCHNDGNNQNNHVSNLRYGTQAENADDFRRHQSHPFRRRERCLRGHLLVAPNLAKWRSREGLRGCLACQRANSYCGHHNCRDRKQEISDRYYAEIMAEPGDEVRRGA